MIKIFNLFKSKINLLHTKISLINEIDYKKKNIEIYKRDIQRLEDEKDFLYYKRTKVYKEIEILEERKLKLLNDIVEIAINKKKLEDLEKLNQEVGE